MDVAEVEENSPSLLEEAGVESAWTEAVDVVKVLHGATQEQHRISVRLPEMHAMDELLHDHMPGIIAHIGEGGAEPRTKGRMR